MAQVAWEKSKRRNDLYRAPETPGDLKRYRQVLTPEMAREAYQSAIPDRREKFELAARECLSKASRQNFIYQYYTGEIMRLAKEELRLRLQMAADRIKQMIDSGWVRPDVQSIRGVYVDMFAQYNHWNRDSFSDLYAKIKGAFEAVGMASTEQQHNVYVLEFSQYQVDISTEFTHDLEFYMATKHPDSPSTTVNVEGNVAFLQAGGISHVTQYIGDDLKQVTEALRSLKSAVVESDEKHAAAISELIDKAIETSNQKDATWPAVAKALDGAQNLIRTTSAVPTAWNFLAALASAHGVSIPHLPSGA